MRVQYERSLSQRLDPRCGGPLRLTERFGNDNYHYRPRPRLRSRGLSLKWFVSPTWYIGGGYAYIWEDRQQAISDAANNKFYLNFGYRALSRGDIEPPVWDQL